MFLLDLRRRFKRSSSGQSGRNLDDERPAATLNREQRAERVRQLQDEVHRLQMEIAGTSRTQPPAEASGERNVTEDQVRELQNELVRVQRTLATLQGRI
jgi:hypothetical protein